MVLPEYMMAGKPIVASRVDAIPSIIEDGENGLLVEVDDAAGASKAVLQIHKNNELREKLIVHGRFIIIVGQRENSLYKINNRDAL